MRILVVEDEPALQMQIRTELERLSFAVDGTGDGKEALYMASEYPFDAAIVDLGLPGLSGLDVIARLRSGGNRLPILILTARSSWQDKVTGLETGGDDYLTKPFQMEELAARLKALLRRQDRGAHILRVQVARASDARTRTRTFEIRTRQPPLPARRRK